MSLYYEDGGLRLFQGNNKTILPSFADASFDSIVTDPPYELTNGKKGGSGAASLNVNSPAGRSRIGTGGFMGLSWDATGIAFDVDMWLECYRVLKPGGYLLAFGGTRTWHRIAVAIEDAGFEVRDSIAWLYGSGFPKSLDVSKAIDKAAGAERGPGVPYIHPRDGVPYVGPEQAQGEGSSFASGVRSPMVTAPATPDAERWQGWGTALKPAFEPIIVARKPLIGTVAANVLEHGTGALNIDATRTEFASDADRRESTDKNQHAKFGTEPGQNNVYGDYSTTEVKDYDGSKGRWPTNVLLDAAQAVALDAQTGVSRSRIGKPRAAASGEGWGMTATGAEYDDEGGASRFFPTFHYEAKAPGTQRPEVDGIAHATVKPLDLMRWLVKLVTRRGGHVLDPFAGSGTTGEAALLEGMECTLIELEAPHLPLILARVRKPLQPSMFGDWGGEAS